MAIETKSPVTQNKPAPAGVTLDSEFIKTLRAKLPANMQTMTEAEIVKVVISGVNMSNYTKLYDKANRETNRRLRHEFPARALAIYNEERKKVNLEPVSEVK